ncbi:MULTISPECIES: carbohydrate ABC transporter permease [Actinomyces]|uniref:carbohydrate ABC transporter permease n=1 Tax=Actinomyces TaxID=1654 RepID=UPI0005BC77C0|nr:MULTISPECIES: carbohydrate ABC transporter permease [Actinomyces]
MSTKAESPKRIILGNVGSVLGIGLILVYCLAPFYWMLVSSLRRPQDIFQTSWWPTVVSFENFASVFDPGRQFGQALINSAIVSLVTTVISLVVATFAAYALARLEFPGKGVLLTLVVATSMFPLVAIIVPLLRLFTDWNWINTYQALIVPYLSFALPLAVWNLNTFFRQMPRELEQAAMVDGCTPWQAFRKIILPLAAPGIFTTAIIVFINAWNEFLIASTMVNNPRMQTAPVALSKFGGASQFETPYGSQMAAGIVVTIPLILLVLFFQRRIVAGLAAGGVKS